MHCQVVPAFFGKWLHDLKGKALVDQDSQCQGDLLSGGARKT
jgi:hypothetical protein